MIEPISPKRTEKPWGYELLIALTPTYAGKILHLNAGHAISLQYHREKDETIHLYRGEAVLHSQDGDGRAVREPIKPGASFHIPPGTIHRLEALADCDFFEVSTTQLDDVVRLEDRYGRTGG